MQIKKLLSYRERRRKEREENPELEKPFLEHLEDLRGTIGKILITLIAATALCLVFSKQLTELIQGPIKAVNPDLVGQLMVTGVADPFIFTIKLAIYAGLILSFPILLYWLAEFILPGLNQKEKKLVLPGVAIGFVLFLIGVAFAYLVVLPRALGFFYNMALRYNWEIRWTIDKYYKFATHFVLVFGLAFELPVVVMILVKLQLLTYRVMSNTRSYAIVVILFIAAILTPPDLATLLMLGTPMVVLYEICIWIAWWMERQRAKREQRREEKEEKEAAAYRKKLAERAGKTSEEGHAGATPPGKPTPAGEKPAPGEEPESSALPADTPPEQTETDAGDAEPLDEDLAAWGGNTYRPAEPFGGSRYTELKDPFESAPEDTSEGAEASGDTSDLEAGMDTPAYEPPDEDFYKDYYGEGYTEESSDEEVQTTGGDDTTALGGRLSTLESRVDELTREIRRLRVRTRKRGKQK